MLFVCVLWQRFFEVLIWFLKIAIWISIKFPQSSIKQFCNGCSEVIYSMEALNNFSYKLLHLRVIINSNFHSYAFIPQVNSEHLSTDIRSTNNIIFDNNNNFRFFLYFLPLINPSPFMGHDHHHNLCFLEQITFFTVFVFCCVLYEYMYCR